MWTFSFHFSLDILYSFRASSFPRLFLELTIRKKTAKRWIFTLYELDRTNSVETEKQNLLYIHTKFDLILCFSSGKSVVKFAVNLELPWKTQKIALSTNLVGHIFYYITAWAVFIGHFSLCWSGTAVQTTISSWNCISDPLEVLYSEVSPYKQPKEPWIAQFFDDRSLAFIFTVAFKAKCFKTVSHVLHVYLLKPSKKKYEKGRILLALSWVELGRKGRLNYSLAIVL